jgi:hypothetical protein
MLWHRAHPKQNRERSHHTQPDHPNRDRPVYADKHAGRQQNGGPHRDQRGALRDNGMPPARATR